MPNIPIPSQLEAVKGPLIVGLIASAERIAQIRRHRLLSLNETNETDYVDHRAITEELVHMRKLCTRHNWPIIDVTRRAIEETAAAVINLLQERAAQAELRG